MLTSNSNSNICYLFCCLTLVGAAITHEVRCSAPQAINLESGSSLLFVLASAFPDFDSRVTANVAMEFDVSN